MTTAQQWLAGARPRTLPAAVAPVLVGTSVAAWEGGAIWERAVLALVVSLSLQVGVNYANDYSDGIRGTDAVRVGPVRLVGQGLAPPAAVRTAALVCFAGAGVAGLALVALSGQWWLLVVGAAAILAAWTYTGGPRPYGYAGMGEVFVFVFFGLVAVCGTSLVQVGSISVLAVLCGVAVGCLSTAILVVNNLRDIPGDTTSGKITLAVRLGDARTRALYRACVLAPLAIASGIAVGSLAGVDWPFAAMFGSAASGAATKPMRAVASGARGPDLVPVLVATGRLLMVYALLLSAGIGLSATWS